MYNHVHSSLIYRSQKLETFKYPLRADNHRISIWWILLSKKGNKLLLHATWINNALFIHHQSFSECIVCTRLCAKHWCYKNKYDIVHCLKDYQIFSLLVMLLRDTRVILLMSSERSSYVSLGILNLSTSVIRAFSF